MNFFIKKWLLLLLAVVFLVAGCGSANEENTKDSKRDETEQTTVPIEDQPVGAEKDVSATSEEEQIVVQEIESVTIVIDPGHQQKANLEHEPIGPGAGESKIKVSGGTQGISTGKPEYILTLESSLLLGEILQDRGFEVTYTRTAHDVNVSNKERAEMANEHQADLFIRMHADGANDSSVKGFSILTISNQNPYTAPIYENSYQAASLILDEVKRDGKGKVNGISYRDDMSGLNWSKVPAILIEMGFMTNPEEDENLSNPVYVEHLMEQIADGIESYVKWDGEIVNLEQKRKHLKQAKHTEKGLGSNK